jgi:hypothetical protein
VTPAAVDEIDGAVGVFEDVRVDRLRTVVELVDERFAQHVLERAFGPTRARDAESAGLLVILNVVGAEDQVVPAVLVQMVGAHTARRAHEMLAASSTRECLVHVIRSGDEKQSRYSC